MALASLQSAGTPSLSDGLQRLQDRYATLQASLSSGSRSDSFAGLGADRSQILGLSPAITRLSGWQSNVTTAQTSLSVTQTALSSIASIASDLHTSLIGLEGGEGSAAAVAAATQARASLQDLAGLVNTRDGNGYVFGGTDTSQAPIPAPDIVGSSSFVQTIQNAVSAVGTTGAIGTQSAIVAAAGNNQAGTSLFNAALSVPSVTANTLSRTVPIGENQTVQLGLVATAGSDAPDTSSTGSPLRDLFGVLAAVSALGTADTANPNTAALISGLTNWSSQINAQLTTATASIGQQQDTLTGQASDLSRTSDALTTQLGALRDSDPAALSVQITAVQNQLTASYSMVADSKSLCLATFL